MSCWVCGKENYRHASERKNAGRIQSGLCIWCYGECYRRVGRNRKRARKQGLEVTLTTLQWIAKIRESQGNCFYCHQHVGFSALVMEHKNPIARGGGTTDENIVPACTDCNNDRWKKVVRGEI